MALKKQMCIHHPDRAAVCECVITRQPICPECTTRYEGVNYSREGLEIFKRRREGQAVKAESKVRLAGWLLTLLAPLLVLLMYWWYLVFFRALTEWMG